MDEDEQDALRERFHVAMTLLAAGANGIIQLCEMFDIEGMILMYEKAKELGPTEYADVWADGGSNSVRDNHRLLTEIVHFRDGILAIQSDGGEIPDVLPRHLTREEGGD